MTDFNNDENLSGSRKVAVECAIDPTNIAMGKFKHLLYEYRNIPLSYKRVARRIFLANVEEILDEMEGIKK